MRKNHKNKLPFIIGTTFMVANLGFSSILFSTPADAQSGPNRPSESSECPSVSPMSLITADSSSMDFYRNDPESFENVRSIATSTNAFAQQEITVLICDHGGVASFGIQASNFNHIDGSHVLPIANNLSLINKQPLICETPWGCGNTQIDPYIPGNFTWTTENDGHTLFWNLNQTGNYPAGYYKTTLNFQLFINSNAPPGEYISNFLLTTS